MFPTISFTGNEVQGGTIPRMGVGFAGDSPNGSTILQDDLTWIKGSHSFKFGYDYRRYFYTDKSLSDAGAFTFSPRATDLPGFLDTTGHAFASFLLGGALRATHGIQGYTQAFRQPQHGVYMQDDWKVTPRLTMNYGFRWEIIPPFFEVTNRMSMVDLIIPNPEAGGRPGALVFRDRLNDTYWKMFGPRFGVAYRATDKMVIRAGYAMTNTPPIRNDWGYGGFTFGFNGNVNVPAGTSSTGFVDDPALYLSQRFPDMRGTLPNTDPSSANYNDVITTAPDANRPGYTQNYNFTIQYELPGSTVFEVAYVGNKGTRMWGGIGVFSELNTLPASMLSLGDLLNEPVADHPQYRPYASFPDDLTVAQALRPYPQFTRVYEAFPYNTNSNYNSMQTTVTRHLSNGLGFLAAYTWSKAIAYSDANGPASYYGQVQDYYNRKLERSVTEFNIPHSFKLTWVYETPFGKGRRFDLGWANWILGGWQLAANHQYRSGDPVSVSQSGVNSPAGFSTTIRPDLVGTELTLGGAPSKTDVSIPTPYLNPAAFAESPKTPDGVPLRVGTAPRFLSSVRGPHIMDETFRMAKRFYFRPEKQYFGIGMTMTNPFNRTTREFLSTSVGDSAFGTLVNRGGGRTIQLDARIEF